MDWINGEPIWISCRGKVIPDSNGKPLLLIGCVNEIGNKNEADNITGLLGIKSFKLNLDNLAKSSSGYLLRIGIDDFKSINEKHGVLVCNQILRELAKMIQSVSHSNQRVYKLDSDEYIIFDNQGTSMIEGIKQFNNLQMLIASQIHDSNYEVVYTVSAGLVGFHKKNLNFLLLMKESQFALSVSKKNGKNQVYIFKEQDYNEFIYKQELLKSLHQAVANNFKGFSLYFQPIVDYKKNKLSSLEALLRFNYHDEIISPNIFIPLLEESKLIIPVGQWIIKTVLVKLNELKNDFPNIKISINLSYIQIIHDVNFYDRLKNSITEYNCQNKIIIELTESGNLDSNQNIKNLWRNLKEFGVNVAIDDFGTGYSNMSNITSLEPNIIKIDYKFTSGALKNLFEFELLKNIISLAHSMNSKVVIEGIETKEDLDKIALLNPDFIQGYYYSKPLPLEELYCNNKELFN